MMNAAIHFEFDERGRWRFGGGGWFESYAGALDAFLGSEGAPSRPPAAAPSGEGSEQGGGEPAREDRPQADSPTEQAAVAEGTP